jgi:hypothetical protein
MNIDNDDNYKIVTIDSAVSKYLNTSQQNFYINLDESLKGVYKLKIISLLINVNNNKFSTSPLDPIYIDLNGYKRLISKHTTEVNGNRNDLYYFESIIVESKLGLTGDTTIKNDYNTYENEYNLNPIEPQLSRITIKLFDKNNQLMSNTDINRFVMKIGLYYSNRNNIRV